MLVNKYEQAKKYMTLTGFVYLRYKYIQLTDYLRLWYMVMNKISMSNLAV